MSEPASVLDGLLVKRYCMNAACPSYGRKRPRQGRYLGDTAIGEPAELLCPDCGETTRITPVPIHSEWIQPVPGRVEWITRGE